MQLIRRGLMLIAGILAMALGGLFAVQNTAKVPLDLLVVQLPPQALAIWILLAMALGVLLGLLSGAVLLMGRSAEIRRLRKQYDQLLMATGKHSSNDSQ
jgi:putative membrane protein